MTHHTLIFLSSLSRTLFLNLERVQIKILNRERVQIISINTFYYLSSRYSNWTNPRKYITCQLEKVRVETCKHLDMNIYKNFYLVQKNLEIKEPYGDYNKNYLYQDANIQMTSL